MELGEVILGRTFLGFLLTNTSMPHLFFKTPSQGKVSVLGWGDQDPPAWRCSKCGTVVFLGKKGE